MIVLKHLKVNQNHDLACLRKLENVTLGMLLVLSNGSSTGCWKEGDPWLTWTMVYRGN